MYSKKVVFLCGTGFFSVLRGSLSLFERSAFLRREILTGSLEIFLTGINHGSVSCTPAQQLPDILH